MGNSFQKTRKRAQRPSEVQYDQFSRKFNAIQFPRNLAFTYENGLFSITNKTNARPYILKQMTFHSQDSLYAFLENLEQIMQFQHPNILKIDSYFVQDNFLKGQPVSYSVNIIMEHFHHTLQDEFFAHQHQGTLFNPAVLHDLMIQMTVALEFLHNHNVSHGCLSPANIYVTQGNVYKICFVGEPVYKTDLGLNPNVFSYMEYMAPKLRVSLTTAFANGNFSCKISHDKQKSDVFSLGMNLLQMISLKSIEGLNMKGNETERISLLKESDPSFPNRIVNLIEGMILENELKRHTFFDIKGLIQIQVDQESEDFRRILRDSFVTSASKFEEKKRDPKNNIEMKTIEDRSGERMYYNIDFSESIISEDHRESSESNNHEEEGGRVSLNKFDLNQISDEDLRNFRARGLGGMAKTLMPTSLSEELLLSQKKGKERNVRSPSPTGRYTVGGEKEKEKEGESNKQRKQEAKTNKFSFDEMLIKDEHELLKPLSFSLHRLVIKLGGQPKHKNIANLMADFIAGQKLLQELVLTIPNMALGSEGMIHIINSMKACGNLRVLFLELRKNRATEEAIRVLGLMLKEKKALVNLGLDLASNSLNPEMCKEIAEGLGGLENLSSLALNMGANQVKNGGLEEISQMIGRLGRIESLVLFLYSNEVESAEGIRKLVESIGKLKSLKSLSIDLSDNLIGDDGGMVILEFLKELKGKQITVELLNNCMSVEIREKILQETGENKDISLRI